MANFCHVVLTENTVKAVIVVQCNRASIVVLLCPVEHFAHILQTLLRCIMHDLERFICSPNGNLTVYNAIRKCDYFYYLNFLTI